MLLDRIFPNRCSFGGRRVAPRRGAPRSLYDRVTTAARKQQRRVKDMRVTVDGRRERVEHRNRQIATLNALLVSGSMKRFLTSRLLPVFVLPTGYSCGGSAVRLGSDDRHLERGHRCARGRVCVAYFTTPGHRARPAAAQQGALAGARHLFNPGRGRSSDGGGRSCGAGSTRRCGSRNPGSSPTGSSWLRAGATST